MSSVISNKNSTRFSFSPGWHRRTRAIPAKPTQNLQNPRNTRAKPAPRQAGSGQEPAGSGRGKVAQSGSKWRRVARPKWRSVYSTQMSAAERYSPRWPTRVSWRQTSRRMGSRAPSAAAPGAYRETCRDYRETCRETYRETCRKTYRETCRETYRETCLEYRCLRSGLANQARRSGSSARSAEHARAGGAWAAADLPADLPADLTPACRQSRAFMAGWPPQRLTGKALAQGLIPGLKPWV